MHGADSMNKNKIAVVGGGAAGVSFTYELVMLFIQNKFNNVQINIFDPVEIGAGLAYQDDLDCLLLNVRSKAMTVKNSLIGDFNEWCNKKGYSNCQYGEDYLPRRLFGFYLKDLFFETIKLAAQHSIILKHIKEEVIDIDKHVTYQVITTIKKYSNFKFVVLAIGNNEPFDYYNLMGNNGYINNPYPIKKFITTIPKNKNVAILGSGLTAVDIALSLNENNHQGIIRMYSRTGLIPSVKGKTTLHQMKFLTQNGLKKQFYKNNKIRLRDIYWLIKKELDAIGECARDLFFNKPSTKRINQFLEIEISKSNLESKWQSIMIETNNIIEEYWNKLGQGDKEIFLKNYHNIWITKRCPMPAINANKIKSAIDIGRINIRNKIESIEYFDNQFIISTKNHQSNYNSIINATGSARNIDDKHSPLLIKNLLNKGYIKESRLGGIKVDFESSAVIDRQDEINFNFRALGHLACGTYYYTSSFIMILRKAKKIAGEFTQIIKSQGLI